MKWISPYFEDGTWIRGNLHTHTDVSDGSHSLKEVVDLYIHSCRYKAAPWMQYRFLAITDHTTSGKKEMYRPIVNPDPDIENEYILIEGREDSFGHHILGIGCRMTFQEDIIRKNHADYTPEDYQRVIDEIVKDGGIAILAHPHWRFADYFSGEMAAALDRYTAIEIINGDRFSGPGHLATDVWDAALTAGKRVWCTGNDDFHDVRDMHNAWNMVLVKEQTKEGVMEALRRGSLYASNGASFEGLHTDGEWIVAECHHDSIFDLPEKTFRFIGQGGLVRQIQTGKGKTAAYKYQGDEKYIRVEMCLSWGMSAFSQPFFPEA